MAATHFTELGEGFTVAEKRTLYRAIAILDGHLRVEGISLSSPAEVRAYLRMTLAGREHEVFITLLLDAQNRLLHADETFRGTLTQTSVYSREIVKLALAHNAGAVIFAHNHPSGVPKPSTADKLLTTHLKQALALVDVKVLDHFIIAGGRSVSFAELRLI